MKNMLPFLKKILFFLITVLFASSCLKSGLPGVNDASLNGLFTFNFQYRYLDTSVAAPGTPNADTIVAAMMVTLNNTQTISNDTIYCKPTFPSSFPANQKSAVSLKSIWGYATIPDGATITPVNGAPKLGMPGDFTSPVTYKVTAANGASKVYVVVVSPLPLVNQYEGNYMETGYFSHPTSPRALSMTKYLGSVDASTVSCDLADLGSNGYTMTIKVNGDNSCVVTQYANGGVIANSQMVPAATNQYYPATKTFILNYQYMGSDGWRTITDTLRRQ